MLLPNVQVLVQGVKINQSNIDYYLHHIEFELNQFEAALSDSFAKLLKLYRRTVSHQFKLYYCLVLTFLFSW